MTFNNARATILVACLVFSTASLAEAWKLGGNTKYQAAINLYDATSIFGSGGNVTALDQDASLRLTAEKRDGNWDYKFHYEAGLIYGNTLEVARSLTLPYGNIGLPTDSTKLFNLTSLIYDEGRASAVQRIDRASARYASGKFVFRAGRDAVSWGNGLVFQPMDIFNPFSPTAVDKEYKPGDDLLYAQWLQQGGSDIQMITVPRRDANGSVTTASSSLAVKYRARLGGADADFLFARHYNENLAGIGAAKDWGGAVVRGDITGTATSSSTVVSAVANISYSWEWSKHNVSGFAEYYRNGFGQPDGNYGSGVLASNTSLVARLSRGEIFNVAQDYLVGGLTVELTPRWQISPTLFWNLNDGSALWQFGATFDWKQNATLLLGGIVPVGPHGTEYGGIPLGGGKFYRPATGVYGRVGYYF